MSHLSRNTLPSTQTVRHQLPLQTAQGTSSTAKRLPKNSFPGGRREKQHLKERCQVWPSVSVLSCSLAGQPQTTDPQFTGSKALKTERLSYKTLGNKTEPNLDPTVRKLPLRRFQCLLSLCPHNRRRRVEGTLKCLLQGAIHNPPRLIRD